jgi:hypothetical protein
MTQRFSVNTLFIYNRFQEVILLCIYHVKRVIILMGYSRIFGKRTILLKRGMVICIKFAYTVLGVINPVYIYIYIKKKNRYLKIIYKHARGSRRASTYVHLVGPRGFK